MHETGERTEIMNLRDVGSVQTPKRMTHVFVLSVVDTHVIDLVQAEHDFYRDTQADDGTTAESSPK